VANARVIATDVAVDDVYADWFDDVAEDCAELLAWLLTGDDVAGLPGSVAGIRVRMTRGERDARWCARAVLASAHAGACGHVGRRFCAGFSPVNSSLLPLHDGMLKNTF
jgi:hypothetical protein